MCNAVMIWRLTYCVISLDLIDPLMNRLDAFHIRRSSGNLNIKHSAHYLVTEGDVVTANSEEFMILAGSIKEIKIKVINEILESRKIQLLGYILRLNQDDLMYPFTCKNSATEK